MNSMFYGNAVTDQQKWLRPQNTINNVQKPNVMIYGEQINRLTERQILLCPNEKIRYDHPFLLKKKKGASRKTIFPKPTANHGPN